MSSSMFRLLTLEPTSATFRRRYMVPKFDNRRTNTIYRGRTGRTWKAVHVQIALEKRSAELADAQSSNDTLRHQLQELEGRYSSLQATHNDALTAHAESLLTLEVCFPPWCSTCYCTKQVMRISCHFWVRLASTKHCKPDIAQFRIRGS